MNFFGIILVFFFVSSGFASEQGIFNHDFLTAVSENANSSSTPFSETEPPDLGQLTPEQKAGQLLIFGIHEQKFTPELKQFIEKTKVGGFVFFKRNISTVDGFQMLLKQIKSLVLENTQMIPFFSIDEEGGSVSRLPFEPKLPSASLIGSTNNPKLAEALGSEIGAQLAKIGLNLNLAPVLDLGGKKSFLGSRTFSPSPKLVASFGNEFSSGIASSNVIPCAKHFPGMGHSSVDPHHDIGTLSFEGPDGFKRSVYPFLKFAQQTPQGAIMMSHFTYPQLDPHRPAVFSPKTYSYLREKLNFDGLVITDDLQMEGIKTTSTRSLGENVFRALKSGSDLVMVSWSRKNQLAVHQYLVKKIKQGAFTDAELNSKLRRIRKAKFWILEGSQEGLRRLASEETDEVSAEPSRMIPSVPNKIFSHKISEVWKNIKKSSRKKR